MQIKRIKNRLTKQFEELCKQNKIENCTFLVCNQTDFINFDYKYYKYNKLTPRQMLNHINEESAVATRSLMFSDYLYMDGKWSYRITLLVENLYKLYYALHLSKTEYTEEELFEFLSICLQHEIGHVIDYIKAFKNAKTEEEINAIVQKRAERQYKDLKSYFALREHLYHTFDEEGPDADYHLCKLEVEKYFSMKAEATANKYAKLDKEKLIEMTIKFQALLEDFYLNVQY